jgi:hypothetical protein
MMKRWRVVHSRRYVIASKMTHKGVSVVAGYCELVINASIV